MARSAAPVASVRLPIMLFGLCYGAVAISVPSEINAAVWPVCAALLMDLVVAV